ncbi:hypothetical protein PIB30_027899 [Stylosanthes scabra]|uniref:Uncharacterized protein n=1 Tax=Stylosanthes scabra TaxID=79078 RepID=A0ABU6Y7Y4_9FABA|nr:hypothetical protein [Stylosanthes scabra]
MDSVNLDFLRPVDHHPEHISQECNKVNIRENQSEHPYENQSVRKIYGRQSRRKMMVALRLLERRRESNQRRDRFDVSRRGCSPACVLDGEKKNAITSRRRRRISSMISKDKRMNGDDDLQGEEENVADDACRRCDGESQ